MGDRYTFVDPEGLQMAIALALNPWYHEIVLKRENL